MRPVGSSSHLQEAGHGADVAGTCSLPHIIHALARLEHNTPGMTNTPSMTRQFPKATALPGTQEGKLATAAEDRENPGAAFTGGLRTPHPYPVPTPGSRASQPFSTPSANYPEGDKFNHVL